MPELQHPGESSRHSGRPQLARQDHGPAVDRHASALRQLPDQEPGRRRGELDLFDRSGRWLRQIGRPGEGPGEYREIMAVELVAGDSIWIFDPPNSRITVLSPEFNVVRTLPLGLSAEAAVVFPPGSVIV